MMFLAYWVHDLSPYLVRFPEGLENTIHLPGIRWYGLAYLAGFVAAYFLLRRYNARGRSPYEGEQILNLMTFLILGVLIGGRLGFFLFYRGNEFVSDPLVIFRVWEGGMASHGGFLGVLVALVWYARITRQSIPAIGDIVVTVTPPGIFFGRIANFINGELHGRPAEEVSWACKFPTEIRDWEPSRQEAIEKLCEPFGVTHWKQIVPAIRDGNEQITTFIANHLPPRHPSQLYAAVLEGLIPFLYIQWRFWRSDHEKRPVGSISGEFLCLYAIVRVVGEIFREPDAPPIFDMSRGQFLSCFLFLGGLGLIVWARRKQTLQATGQK